MGLTWMLEDVGGVRTVRHGGGTVGQQTTLVLVPSRNFALTVLTNSEPGQRVAYRGDEHGFSTTISASRTRNRRRSTARRSNLRPMLGRYTAAGSRPRTARGR